MIMTRIKFLYILILPLLLFQGLYGQKIKTEDLKKIMPYLKAENYKYVYDRTLEMLKASPEDSSDLRAMVKYYTIYSAAGLVSNQEMSIQDFSRQANEFIGQKLMMPKHTCLDSVTKVYNAVQFFNQNQKIKAFTLSPNAQKLKILSFEYFDFRNKIKPSDYYGKAVRCVGILKGVETNITPTQLWISRLYIGDALIRIAEKD
jgi:hypothetical protein